MKILLFLVVSVFCYTLFQKIQDECANHPTIIKAGGTCMIVNDSSVDVKANYLYYFCNLGHGSWKHFEFYLIHSQNPWIYDEFSNELFCKEANHASLNNYTLMLQNISRLLSC